MNAILSFNVLIQNMKFYYDFNDISLYSTSIVININLGSKIKELTGADVDLSQYALWKISNGGSWYEADLTLSGTLSDGDVYVVANSSADPTILAQADITWGSANWNGDDAVGLAKNDGYGTFFLIDAVGEEGGAPGTGWDVAGVSNATANHTLVRKSTIPEGNTNWASSAGTDADDSEWIVYDQDTFDYIGYHDFGGGGELEFSTTYYWQIAPYNANGDAIGCNVWQFTTMDDPTVTTYPWTEGFENGGAIPVGWTQEYVYGTVDWTYQNGGYNGNPSAAYEGSYNAHFYYGSYSAYTTQLITPPLDLSGLNNPTLNFAHAQDAWGSDQDVLRVYYKTTPDGAWQLLETYDSEVATWTLREITLPNPSSTYYIAFEGEAHYGYGVCIDEVKVWDASYPPDCTTPISPVDMEIDVAFKSAI